MKKANESVPTTLQNLVGRIVRYDDDLDPLGILPAKPTPIPERVEEIGRYPEWLLSALMAERPLRMLIVSHLEHIYHRETEPQERSEEKLVLYYDTEFEQLEMQEKRGWVRPAIKIRKLLDAVVELHRVSQSLTSD